MKSIFLSIVFLAALAVSASGQMGEPTVCTSNSCTGTQPSSVFIDVSLFAGATGDAKISAAITAMAANATAVLDGTALGSTITFAQNPFQGLIGFVAPQKCGVLRFSGSHLITLNAPLVIPTCWRFEATETWPLRLLRA